MKRLALLVAVIIITGCKGSAENHLVNQEDSSIIQTSSGEISGSQKEVEDYKTYIGQWKLSVAEDKELYLLTALEDYFGATGISISEINNNAMKGSIYSIQGAPSYRQAECAFEGTIEDGRLTATYKDEGWEYTGHIELIFENERIRANITRDEVEIAPMWGIPEGEFEFVRPLHTEEAALLDDDKSKLENFLFPINKNAIQPFDKEELTDEMIINFVGINLGLGILDTSGVSDKIKEKDAEMIFDEAVMDSLANTYFGLSIKEHKSYEIIKYARGMYTVPALGGMSPYPIVQSLMKMKERANEETYYAIVDYTFDFNEEGILEYEYLVELQKNDYYTIKAIKEIKSPIDFKVLNELRQFK